MDCFSCHELKEVYDILLKTLHGIDIYACGGIVPYLLLNEDSNRLHHDIDCIVAMDDMEMIREKLICTDYYNEKADSINVLSREYDFGLEICIHGISIGIYPYCVKDNQIIQYSYHADNGRFKCKILKDSIFHYLKEYQSNDGFLYKTMSLEYLRKSKELASREKDRSDVEAIDRYGFDKELYDNIEVPNPVNFLDVSLDEMKEIIGKAIERN